MASTRLTKTVKISAVSLISVLCCVLIWRYRARLPWNLQGKSLRHAECEDLEMQQLRSQQLVVEGQVQHLRSTQKLARQLEQSSWLRTPRSCVHNVHLTPAMHRVEGGDLATRNCYFLSYSRVTERTESHATSSSGCEEADTHRPTSSTQAPEQKSGGPSTSRCCAELLRSGAECLCALRHKSSAQYVPQPPASAYRRRRRRRRSTELRRRVTSEPRRSVELHEVNDATSSFFL